MKKVIKKGKAKNRKAKKVIKKAHGKKRFAIKNQYEGKTVTQVWNAWNETQRLSFLSAYAAYIFDVVDNNITTEQTDKLIEYSTYSFDKLPKKVKDVAAIHVFTGEFEKGGKTPHHHHSEETAYSVIIFFDKENLSWTTKKIEEILGVSISDPSMFVVEDDRIGIFGINKKEEQLLWDELSESDKVNDMQSQDYEIEVDEEEFCEGGHIYMEGGTLERLKHTVEKRDFGYNLPHLNNAMYNTGSKAVLFIENLAKDGIPLSAIGTTDWNSAPIKVYVTIPYGRKNGGKSKAFKRFSELDFKNALKFWNTSEAVFEHGGKIKNQYAGKTAKEVWGEWTHDQRYHFIKDHRQEIPELKHGSFEENVNTLSKEDIFTLPLSVNNALFSHIEEGQYKHGGSIPNNYAGKTAKEVWEAWDEDQRLHFLLDHSDDIFGMSLQEESAFGENYDKRHKYKKLPFDQLSTSVWDALQTHIEMGQYKHGGSIPNNYAGRTAEDIWDSWRRTQRYHFLEDHSIHYGIASEEWTKYDKTEYKELPRLIQSAVQDHKDQGQYAGGGVFGDYAIVSRTKDNYLFVLTRPVTKKWAEENFKLFTDNLGNGEVGEIMKVDDIRQHKKVVGLEYLEKDGQYAGGGTTKSDYWIAGSIEHKGSLRRKAKEMGLIKGDEKLTFEDLDKLEALGGVWGYRAREARNLMHTRHTGRHKAKGKTIKRKRGGSFEKFRVGQSVIIKSDNDNENYEKYRGKELVITHKATSEYEHQGYDSAMQGEGLYDLQVRKTGEDVPFSLYDYEIEKYAKGGKLELTTEDAIREAEAMGVDFDKSYHEQTHGNELAELAKKYGYRKSKSSPMSTSRAFFEYLEKYKSQHGKHKHEHGGIVGEKIILSSPAHATEGDKNDYRFILLVAEPKLKSVLKVERNFRKEGKWDGTPGQWYIGTLANAEGYSGTGERTDVAMIDGGQNWYVTGLHDAVDEAEEILDGGTFSKGGKTNAYKIGDLVFAKNEGSRGLVGLIVSEKHGNEIDVLFRGYSGDVFEVEISELEPLLDGHLSHADNNGDISAYTSIAKKREIALNPIYQEALDQESDDIFIDDEFEGGGTTGTKAKGKIIHKRGSSTVSSDLIVAGVPHTRAHPVGYQSMPTVEDSHPLGTVYLKDGKGYVALGYDWYEFDAKYLPKLKKARYSGNYAGGGTTKSKAKGKTITKLRSIEKDTDLLASVIAEMVAERTLFKVYEATEQDKNWASLSQEEKDKFNLDYETNKELLASHLERRANHLYNVKADFRKKVQGAGNKGRDYLYMFMQHWADAWVSQKYGHATYEKYKKISKESFEKGEVFQKSKREMELMGSCSKKSLLPRPHEVFNQSQRKRIRRRIN